MRINWLCERCEGAAVTREAWAEWDVARQQWVLCETFDFAFCHQCHRATKLVEREVPEGRAQSILPRQGEVAPKATEGEDGDAP